MTNVRGDGKVLWHTSMSLDGFVAGPNHTMEWMSLDWLPKRESGLPAQAQLIADTTGAILAGRRWHDALDRLGGLDGIYGGVWTGPVFVLTSRPDASLAHKGVTFVSDGIKAAVSTAIAAAEGRNLVGRIVQIRPVRASHDLHGGTPTVTTSGPGHWRPTDIRSSARLV
jgi:dihydrofolate reductase